MIPENEMGVIVLFAQQAQEAGFEIIEIGCEYPDALIKKDERVYRAEFEYKSSNFNQHGHDPRECDLIICWIRDTTNHVLPILALSEPNWKFEQLIIPETYKAEIEYWKQRALKAEKKIRKPRVKRLSHQEIIKPSKDQKRQMAIDFIRQFPAISGAELGRKLGASDRTGQNILNELEQAGTIHKNGSGWKVQS